MRVVNLPSGKRSVQLTESYRVGTKVRKRIVRHIGSALPGAELEQMRRKAAVKLERMRSASQGNIFADTAMVDMAVRARQLHQLKNKCKKKRARRGEKHRVMLGIHEVFGELYERACLDGVFTKRHVRTRLLLRDAVLMRLAAQGRSKRAHARLMGIHLGTPASADQIYRMMDALDDERIAKMHELVGRQASETIGSSKASVACSSFSRLLLRCSRSSGFRH